MYVCMHVCMYVYVCMYVCMYVYCIPSISARWINTYSVILYMMSANSLSCMCTRCNFLLQSNYIDNRDDWMQICL